MAVLEQEGYLAQPHTSAGRIPTDKGYRFFVDHLTAPGRLDAAQRAQVGDFFAQANVRLEEMLPAPPTCSPISPPTPRWSSVPDRGGDGPQSIQLVGLSSRYAMVVAVLSNGNGREPARRAADG